MGFTGLFLEKRDFTVPQADHTAHASQINPSVTVHALREVRSSPRCALAEVRFSLGISLFHEKTVLTTVTPTT